ncbi:MAG: toll/interleukin-1 receptor domain-containing protein [Luteolibacter sp.]
MPDQQIADKPSSEPSEYWCFISYRHADNKEQDRDWATWLHHEIERYDIPFDLVGTTNKRGDLIKDRIYPVFRDEESLPADTDLSNVIGNALDRSKFMVVLCSPRAVESRYVAQEITHFKKSGKQDKIIAAILAGEPGSAAEECFPAPLRQSLGTDGELRDDASIEPIAADFRIKSGAEGFTTAGAYRLSLKHLPDKEARKLANAYADQLQLMKLKIIAGILGVPLEELRNRDKAYQLELSRKRARNLYRWLSVVGLSLILAVIGAFAAWKARDAEITQRMLVEKKGKELAATFARSDFRQALTTGNPYLRTDLLERSLATSPTPGARAHLAFDRNFKRHSSLFLSSKIEEFEEPVFFQADDHLYVQDYRRLLQYDTSQPDEPAQIFEEMELLEISPDRLFLILKNDKGMGVYPVPLTEKLQAPLLSGGFLAFHGDGHDVISTFPLRAEIIDPESRQTKVTYPEMAMIPRFGVTEESTPTMLVANHSGDTLAFSYSILDATTYVIRQGKRDVTLINHRTWSKPLIVSEEGNRILFQKQGDGGGAIYLHDLASEKTVFERWSSTPVLPVPGSDRFFFSDGNEVLRCAADSVEPLTSKTMDSRVTAMKLTDAGFLAVGMENGYVELLNPSDLSRIAQPIVVPSAVEWIGYLADTGRIVLIRRGGYLEQWTVGDMVKDFESVATSEQVMSLSHTEGKLEAVTFDQRKYVMGFGNGILPVNTDVTANPGGEPVKRGEVDITTPETQVRINRSGLDVIRGGSRTYYSFAGSPITATALDAAGNFLALGFADGKFVLIDLAEKYVLEPDWKAEDEISSLLFFPENRSLVIGSFQKIQFFPLDWMETN